jgi:hypothetical protein
MDFYLDSKMKAIFLDPTVTASQYRGQAPRTEIAYTSPPGEAAYFNQPCSDTGAASATRAPCRATFRRRRDVQQKGQTAAYLQAEQQIPPPERQDQPGFNAGWRKDLTEEDVRFTVKGKTLYPFVTGCPQAQGTHQGARGERHTTTGQGPHRRDTGP